MFKLRDEIVKLYKKAATSLPSDVEAALKSAHAEERSNAKAALAAILENIRLARITERPICRIQAYLYFF